MKGIRHHRGVIQLIKKIFLLPVVPQYKDKQVNNIKYKHFDAN